MLIQGKQAKSAHACFKLGTTLIFEVMRQHLWIFEDAMIDKTEVVQDISPQRIVSEHTCVAKCARLLEASSHVKYLSDSST